MNWKKWDKYTWVNMCNGHLLKIVSYRDNADCEQFYVIYEKAEDIYTPNFTTYVEAAAFVEELIK